MQTYQQHPDHLVVSAKIKELCESVLVVDFFWKQIPGLKQP
ncbi:MAG: Dabb family protein [Deltaproteobacteria bacterium]|nr:MAG: Dabb family protein [Deltaproteobacteria bacterium]